MFSKSRFLISCKVSYKKIVDSINMFRTKEKMEEYYPVLMDNVNRKTGKIVKNFVEAKYIPILQQRQLHAQKKLPFIFVKSPYGFAYMHESGKIDNLRIPLSKPCIAMTVQEFNDFKMNCGNTYERHVYGLDVQESKNNNSVPNTDTTKSNIKKRKHDDKQKKHKSKKRKIENFSIE